MPFGLQRHRQVAPRPELFNPQPRRQTQCVHKCDAFLDKHRRGQPQTFLRGKCHTRCAVWGAAQPGGLKDTLRVEISMFKTSRGFTIGALTVITVIAILYTVFW